MQNTYFHEHVDVQCLTIKLSVLSANTLKRLLMMPCTLTIKDTTLLRIAAPKLSILVSAKIPEALQYRGRLSNPQTLLYWIRKALYAPLV